MLTVTLSLLLVATAVWVRRTVPLVMVWTGLFVLLPDAGDVPGGRAAARRAVAADRPVERPVPGRAVVPRGGLGRGPPGRPAAAVGGGRRRRGWCARRACLYLRRRIQAVEIVQ